MGEGQKARVNFHSGTPWETLRGHSRAVRVGEVLYISGTTAMREDGEVVGVGDAYEQTKFVIAKVKGVLAAAGFSPSDVVRTRLFVTDLRRWDEYAKAHRQAFDAIRPASSIVEVVRLVDRRLLIEMEAEALLGCSQPDKVQL